MDINLREWAKEAFTPVVLTDGTDEVDRICGKNGLELHTLFSAFGTLHRQTPVRTPHGHKDLKNFKVDFVPMNSLRSVPIDLHEGLAEDIVRQRVPQGSEQVVLTSVSDFSLVAADGSTAPAPLKGPPKPDWLEFRPLNNAEDAESAARHEMSPRTTPWFGEFWKSLWDIHKVMQHEMLQSPTVIIKAVSTTDPDPVRALEITARDLPRGFHNGHFDHVKCTKLYLLIHDQYEAVGKNPDQILKTIKKTYAPSKCKLITINSIPPEQVTKDAVADASLPPLVLQARGRWDAMTSCLKERIRKRCEDVEIAPSQAKPPVVAVGGVTGSLLSQNDLLSIQDYVEQVVQRGVLPGMEENSQIMYQQISAVRKGIKNMFKNALTWRKPKDTKAAGEVAYRFDSIESQIRAVGDLTLMMQHYELALQMYKLVRDDFKSDNAYAHSAGINEMIALCSFLTDATSRNDIDKSVEEAFRNYRHQRDHFELSQIRGDAATRKRGKQRHQLLYTRLATRAAILGSMIYCHGKSPRHLDAAELLLKAAEGETPFCKGLLLEQAALCYLRSTPQPLFRRFSHRLWQAGDAYTQVHRSFLLLNFVSCCTKYPASKEYSSTKYSVSKDISVQNIQPLTDYFVLEYPY
jgi:hypothetical protein